MFTKMTCVHVLCPISHSNPPKQFDPNASHWWEGGMVIFILQGLRIGNGQGSKTLFSFSFGKISRAVTLEYFFCLWQGCHRFHIFKLQGLCTIQYPSYCKTNSLCPVSWVLLNSKAPMLLLKFSMGTSRDHTRSAHLVPLLWINTVLIFCQQTWAGFVCLDHDIYSTGTHLSASAALHPLRSVESNGHHCCAIPLMHVTHLL